MQKHFVADEGFPKELSRKRAAGYKKIIIDDSVVQPCAVDFVTEGDTLRIMGKPIEEDGEEPFYIILTKEFGVVGEASKFSSKISIIYCDNGWMLVTLMDGALILNLMNQLLAPCVNTEELPPFSEDNIYWVTEETMLSYAKYWDDKSTYPYDFEFVFVVKGGVVRNMHTFNVSHIGDEDIDMSLGQFALQQQRLMMRQQAKEAKKISSMIGSSTSTMDWDDDDDNSGASDDDDDDDVDY